MRVLVGVPMAETVRPECFKALWGMGRAGCELGFEAVRGYGCDMARNRIAELALEGGFDACLMVDSDVAVPPHALASLLSCGADVALGWYRDGRDASLSCLCRHESDNYDLQYGADELRALREAGAAGIPVKGGGFGCALVRTAAFARVPWPWFRFETYTDGHGVLSEDLWFCERCAGAGIPIVGDVRVECGHVRHVTL